MNVLCSLKFRGWPVKVKNGYQPRANVVKDENVNMLGDSHNILNWWKNYFCQLLNVLMMLTEMHTPGPLVPEPSSFELEIAIEKFKSYILIKSSRAISRVRCT
jgi:hypothetical protein